MPDIHPIRSETEWQESSQWTRGELANSDGSREKYLEPFSEFERREGEKKVEVSIVIPLLNEAENLADLYGRLKAAMDSLDRSVELILVDDGSTDNSYSLLIEIQREDPRVRVIRLRRNFGQTAAFSAGFDLAYGQIIITMDGDLQNDPADIPLLLKKMDEGYDIVSGWRINRQDVFLTRRLPSQMANALISRVTGVHLHDYGCSLKAYRREIVKNIHLYGELHRFIPAIASWMGVRVAEVPVTHHARQYGRSKYGLNRTVKVFLDLLTVKFLLDYATRPIQIFGLVGLLSFGGGSALAFYLAFVRLVMGQAIGNRPLLLLAILLILLGVQLIIMGLLGELVIRTYHEAQNKSIYVIREILDGSTGVK